MNEQNNTTIVEKPSKKGITFKPWQIILTILVIVALIGGGIFVGVNWNNWFGEKTPVADVDTGAKDWNGTDLPDRTDSDGKPVEGIQIPGYPSINLPKDTTDVQVALLNPKGNPCYFTFEIVLKDTNETIYKSKQVPPGKAVTDLKLTKPLSAGTYKATIKITTNSLTDMSPMNGANVETELVVK